MSMTVEIAGQRVKRVLESAERMTNETSRAYAELQTAMLDVRLETDLPQYQGQVAMLRLQEAQKLVIEAQGQLARVHKAMREEFIEVTAGPDEPRCPIKPTGFMEVNVA